MAKVWFEAKTISEAIKLAIKIYDLDGFTDCCVMVETPKKATAVVGGEKAVTKEKLIEIEKRKWE